ncbi:MAG: hypothetical protein PHQ53_07760 [Candidatus Krumholzibacteria bacterium]|nr:hypothetical protein [Candidatus Krumholzibacteria bacterium]
MSINTFLAIASFALSIGGLLSSLFFKERKKEIAVVVVVTALVVTTGIALLRNHQEQQLIVRVQEEALAVLSSDALTFDEIYQRLHFRPFSVVNEAMFRSVERGTVGHRLVEFHQGGKITTVRLYFAESR